MLQVFFFFFQVLGHGEFYYYYYLFFLNIIIITIIRGPGRYCSLGISATFKRYYTLAFRRPFAVEYYYYDDYYCLLPVDNPFSKRYYNYALLLFSTSGNRSPMAVYITLARSTVRDRYIPEGKDEHTSTPSEVRLIRFDTF